MSRSIAPSHSHSSAAVACPSTTNQWRRHMLDIPTWNRKLEVGRDSTEWGRHQDIQYFIKSCNIDILRRCNTIILNSAVNRWSHISEEASPMGEKCYMGRRTLDIDKTNWHKESHCHFHFHRRMGHPNAGKSQWESENCSCLSNKLL